MNLPLTELVELHLIRHGKPESNALPSNQYRNPANTATMKGIRMHLKAADIKIQAWWVYSRIRDMELGYPDVSPMFKEVKSSRQWETTDDLVAGWERAGLMEKVDELMESLDGAYRAAIAAEMRNREDGMVWRTGTPYQDALEAVDMLLRDAGLL